MSSPVRRRLTAISAALGAIVLAFGLASCGSQPSSPTAPAVNSGQTDAKGGATEQCISGGVKDERAPFTATAPEGQLVTGVCVKAGTQTIALNGSDACYTVSGLGTSTATVVKTGTESSCKDISYATFYTAAPTPTPTPTDVATPTPTNTPTDTPTTTPTNTPTDTPTPTPTNTPTNTPTDTPTPTPTNTPTDTPTPTPTNTPTNTPTPTLTNTPTPTQGIGAS